MSKHDTQTEQQGRLARARRRALRAAQAVALAGTLTLGLGACGARSTSKPDRGNGTDSGSGGADVTLVRLDAGTPKKDLTVDGNPCANGCGSNPGCPCVGPFVPPEQPA